VKKREKYFSGSFPFEKINFYVKKCETQIKTPWQQS